MTRDRVALLTPCLSKDPLPRTTATKRFIVLKHRVDDGQNLSCHGDFCRRKTTAPANPAIQTLQTGISIGCMDTDLHTDPPKPTRALFGDPAMKGLIARAVHARNQTGVRT